LTLIMPQFRKFIREALHKWAPKIMAELRRRMTAICQVGDA
jgi:hypothetical protein